MANGGHQYTDEEWNRMDAEISLLDADLERFALAHGGKIDKKTKDLPTRCIHWKSNVRSLLQVYFVDSTPPTLNFWICVSRDSGGKRFWKQEMLLTKVRAADIANELSDTLEAGKRKIDVWAARPEELDFATDLQI